MENEYELIYLWRTECNAAAKEKLFNHYYGPLRASIYRLMCGKFYSIPVEWYEFDSLIYRVFLVQINRFNYRQTKYTFAQALFTVMRSESLRYITSFITNKQAVLNNALSYDEKQGILATQAHSNSVEAYINADIEKVNLQTIKRFVKTQPEFVQKVINYKCNNYSNKQVAKILGVKVKKIANTYNCFILKAKKEIKTNNNFYI